MSNSTPPGWYPDPQRGPDGGAAQERYWDGGGWTAQTRPPAAPPRWDAVGPAVPPPHRSVVSDASPAYGHPAVPAPVEPPGYGFPPQPPAPAAYGFPQPAPYPPVGPPAYPPTAPYGGPYLPPQPPRQRTGLIVGVLAGALLLVGVTVVGAAALLSGSAGPSSSAAVAPTPAASAPADGAAPQPAQPTPGPSDQPQPQSKAPVSPDGSSATDTTHGWTVPLPTGWTSTDHGAGTALLTVTTPYDCSTPGGCVRGSFSIDSAPTQGADAQSVARATIADYAPQLYGDLASHQELASAPITAAGLTGYAVRWHVVPSTGTQGYILLVALPSAGGGFSILVGSVDDDPSAPQPAVLEQIVAGIRVAAPANGV